MKVLTEVGSDSRTMLGGNGADGRFRYFSCLTGSPGPQSPPGCHPAGRQGDLEYAETTELLLPITTFTPKKIRSPRP